MKNKHALIIAGLVVLMLGTWGMIWFLDHFELRNEEVDHGYTSKARNNDLLAAELWLKKLGYPVQVYQGREPVKHLPDTRDSIVVYRFYSPALAEQRQSLMQWIEAGGNLIIAADDAWNEDNQSSANAFLDELGIRAHDHQDPLPPLAREFFDLAETEARKYGEDEPPCAVSEHATSIKFSGYEHPISVEFDPRRYLQDSDNRAASTVAIEEGDGAYLLQLKPGDGMLTVLSDNRFWHNTRICQSDHALFLAQLLGPPPAKQSDDAPTVWFWYDNPQPTLVSLLWDNAPQLLVSLALLLLLAAWSISGHLGPMLPSLRTQRRSLGEHLDAVGEYQWRLNHAEHLFKRHRSQVERAWLRRHAILQQQDQRERCLWLSQRTGLSPEQIELALYLPVTTTPQLIQASQALQRLALQRLDTRR